MSQHASGASETAHGGKAPLVLAIDQSTSGTKALLFGGNGELLGRCDRPHRQKISENGWVSHDPMERDGSPTTRRRSTTIPLRW